MNKLQYIDTHAHLNLTQFTDDYETVATVCAEQQVGVVNVGTNKTSSTKAVELADTYAHMWAIVGVHPLEVISEAEPETALDTTYYKGLLEHPKAVGIGECGFDYFHHGDSSYKTQRDMLEAQIALATETKLPLMLHLRNTKDGQGRNAYDDALDILKNEATTPANAHFYAGTLKQAKQFLELGGTISFTGVLTFTPDYDEIVRYVPLDRLHAETDCPYVAPVPHRGKRAEPWMVIEVYKRIAEIKELDEEIVREQLVQNAQELYKLT